MSSCRLLLYLPRFVNGFKPPDVNEHRIPVLKRFLWRSLCQWFRKLYTPVYSVHTLFISEVFGIIVMRGCLLSKLEKILVV